MIRKALLALGVVTFSLFTYLQLNDATQYGNSDAWTWIMLYSTSAVLSGVLLWRSLPANWLYAWMGFTWGSLFFRLQDEHGNFYLSRLHPMNYWDPTGTTMIQNSNECGGLLILSLWACLLIYLNKNLIK